MDVKKLLLQENVGGVDLFVRSAVGALAITALAMDLVSGFWRFLLALAAFGGLFTALTRHCTPYGFFGFSTKK